MALNSKHLFFFFFSSIIQLSGVFQDFRFVIDHCDSAAVNENIDISSSDRSSCEALGTAPGDDYILNVNTPVQLGGREDGYNYPSGLTRQSYKGCLKNLWHNGMVSWQIE